MPVTCVCNDRNLTAKLSGEVDHHGAKAMMEELERQIDLNLPRHLVLDLSGVTFMDSSGIAVLLRAWRRVGELSGSVSVVRVPEQAARVLRAAGIDRLMRFE
jgi:stage II sporulation protein AA (anti-sigma F factor antagonist)